MIRLHAVVEGQTEETFMRDVRAPKLGARGIFIDAHRITTRREKSKVFRGGISGYGQLKNDLELWNEAGSASGCVVHNDGGLLCTAAGFSGLRRVHAPDRLNPPGGMPR